jgi:N-acetylmuramoyl-L-alanine amidase
LSKNLIVVLDAGHGGRDSKGIPTTPGKRSPDGMLEYDFNSRVAEVMKAELEKYEGLSVYFTHESGRDVPLQERTGKANKLKADVFVSIHANANAGVMGDHGGIETFVYTTKPKEATALATKVQAELVKATGLRNRGVKYGNFHVLRETYMTAILIEHGFMDSKTDLPKLKSEEFRKLCAETNVKALAEFYGLKRKPAPAPAPKPVVVAAAKTKPNVLYKVQVGAFASKENAEKLAKQLNKDGYNTYIVEEAKK